MGGNVLFTSFEREFNFVRFLIYEMREASPEREKELQSVEG